MIEGGGGGGGGGGGEFDKIFLSLSLSPGYFGDRRQYVLDSLLYETFAIRS